MHSVFLYISRFLVHVIPCVFALIDFSWWWFMYSQRMQRQIMLIRSIVYCLLSSFVAYFILSQSRQRGFYPCRSNSILVPSYPRFSLSSESEFFFCFLDIFIWFWFEVLCGCQVPLPIDFLSALTIQRTEKTESRKTTRARSKQCRRVQILAPHGVQRISARGIKVGGKAETINCFAYSSPSGWPDPGICRSW